MKQTKGFRCTDSCSQGNDMSNCADCEYGIDMILFCPSCGLQHIDAPDEGVRPARYSGRIRTDGKWDNPPHRSHLCHGCGHIWRPADVATNGVIKIATIGKNDSEPVIPTHWKIIATKLKDGLKAAINYGRFRGCMIDFKTNEMTGMYGYLADHLEAYPGIKIDRELLGLTSRQIAKVKRERAKSPSIPTSDTQDQAP